MARGQLPRAYLRIDPNLDQHPDADGMLRLICAANRQIPRGRFPGRDVLRRILGSAKRLEAFLRPRHAGKRADVLLQEDGSFYLDGWDEWNEGDLTVGDRMRRVREKRAYSRNKAVTEPSPDRIADRNSPSEASRRLGGISTNSLSSPERPGGGEKKGALELLRCPRCNAPDSLIRERATPRRTDPGWWCVPDRGGCNTNFHLGDERIIGKLPENVQRSVLAELQERHGPAPDPARAAAEDRDSRLTATFYAAHGGPQDLARRCAEWVRANAAALTDREGVDRWLDLHAAPHHVRIEVIRRALRLLEALGGSACRERTR